MNLSNSPIDSALTLTNELFEIRQSNSGNNPAFDLIGLTQLRNNPQFAGIDGSGFSVAVLDTGIDFNHSLIEPNYITGYDFVDNDSDPFDPHGHGTHVSGIVGATDNTIGVAPDVGLIGLRVANRNGLAKIRDIEDALVWVLANREQYNITAVNLSLGVGFFTSPEEVPGNVLIDDIQRLEAAGVTIVASAGNSYSANADRPNQANIAFPAIYSTIAVGAVWQDDSLSNIAWSGGSIDYSTGADRITSFSQRLTAPNVLFAPGAIITSTLPGQGLGGFAGTSQAAPHITGAVALLQEASLQFKGRLLTPQEITEILRATGQIIIDGDDEDDNLANSNSSYVRINIYNAIAKIKGSNDIDGSIALVGQITTLPMSDRLEVIGADGIQQVGAQDVDFYRFNSAEVGILEITVESQAADPLDSVLLLFDSKGNSLAVKDQIDSNNSQLRFQIQPNTDYYVAVTGFGNQNFTPFIQGSGGGGDTGNYTINGSLKPISETASLVDDTIASPAVQTITSGITLLGNVGSDNGLLIGNTDIDLYRFNSDIDNRVKIKTKGANAYLRVIDASGNEIAADDSFKLDRMIELEAIAKEQYYIEVSGNHNFSPANNSVLDSSGNYNLSIISDRDLVPGSQVYRFFRPNLGVHFYTASIVERDTIVGNLANYIYEGESYISAASTADPFIGIKPVYRFLNTTTRTHFYTISETERDNTIINLNNYSYEGIAYYGYTSDRPGVTPLYRFYNPVVDAHFYTPSAVERDAVLINLPDYQLESNNGIAFYVEPTSSI
ncbi:MAG: S8 family serine peptidase [Cyanobacteria bacterium P01_G01_bin.39]